MNRVHAARTTHVPSTVSSQAKAKGVDRIRHRDESRYQPPVSHGALIAALPMAGSLLASNHVAEVSGQVAWVCSEELDVFDMNDLMPIAGGGLAALGFVLVALRAMNAIAKHQAMRSMMDRAIDKFPQINANVVMALTSYRVQHSIPSALAPEVSDPKSWPLLRLSRGFVRLAKDFSDMLDADMSSESLLGRVGPTALLSNYGMSEFIAGRSDRMRFTAQLLYGESEGFTEQQRRHLNNIFFGTPFKSFGGNIGSNIMILKRAAAEHEFIARVKKPCRVAVEYGHYENRLARGVHHTAAAMIWRRRAHMLDTHEGRATDLAKARRNLDEAQWLFDEVRDVRPDWFSRSYSNLGSLAKRVGALKKVVQFDMFTSDSPPPPTPIRPAGGGAIDRGGGPLPPTAACVRLGAFRTFASMPWFTPTTALIPRF